MHKLEQIIRAARATGRQAVIPFLTAFFPERDSFWEHLEAADQAGADIIEIGVPFSDPVADGPVVEDASRRALENGANLPDLLADLAVRCRKYRAALVLMGYYNPFYQYGLDKLAQDAARAGIGGLIIPDLPLDEAAPLRKAIAQSGIALIPLVGPNTSLERMRMYAQTAAGYAYVVSVMGTTGARESLAAGVAEVMRRARAAFTVPLALGFGLSRPGQLDVLPADAQPDAAVVGSALLRHIDEGGSARDFLAPWLAR